MRSPVTRALGLVGLALAAAATAAAQSAPPTLGVLVNQVVSLFPRVNGDVLEVQGSTVTLSIGRRNGLVAGVELSLYREGRELRHPKTGEILGRTEEAVGTMTVQQVFEAYSTGTIVSGADVRPGDRARVSAGKIKLTLLPIVDGVKDGVAEAATYELIEALNRTDRFQIALGDAINVWLRQQHLAREDVLAGKGLDQVARRFKIEHLLVVSFSRVERKPYVDVRLFSLPAANALLTTALFVPPAIKAAPRGGDFSGSARSRESQTPGRPRSLLARLLTGELDAGTYSSGESAMPLKEIAKFPFAVVAMDVVVAPADRVARMVVTDGQKVYLYRIVDRVLEPEWTYPGAPNGRVFSVQLADLDGDGVLEVVANRYDPNPAILMNSFILTTRAGRPAVLLEGGAEILLAVDEQGDGIKRTLWMEPFVQNGFFKRGDAQRASVQDGKLVATGRVRVPASFRATGATFANIPGKGSRALVFIDEFERLRVSVDTEDMWRSATPVGGGGSKLEVMTQIERGGRSFIYQSAPQPLAVDLDGDGIEEVVVPQNQLPGRLAVVYKGPAGYRFQTVNSGFEGTITALGAIPAEDGGDAPTLVVAVVRYQNFFNTVGDTQIIVTTGE